MMPVMTVVNITASLLFGFLYGVLPAVFAFGMFSHISYKYQIPLVVLTPLEWYFIFSLTIAGISIIVLHSTTKKLYKKWYKYGTVIMKIVR